MSVEKTSSSDTSPQADTRGPLQGVRHLTPEQLKIAVAYYVEQADRLQSGTYEPPTPLASDDAGALAKEAANKARARETSLAIKNNPFFNRVGELRKNGSLLPSDKETLVTESVETLIAGKTPDGPVAAFQKALAHQTKDGAQALIGEAVKAGQSSYASQLTWDPSSWFSLGSMFTGMINSVVDKVKVAAVATAITYLPADVTVQLKSIKNKIGTFITGEKTTGDARAQLQTSNGIEALLSSWNGKEPAPQEMEAMRGMIDNFASITPEDVKVMQQSLPRRAPATQAVAEAAAVAAVPEQVKLPPAEEATPEQHSVPTTTGPIRSLASPFRMNGDDTKTITI